jgi:hypothetical protein
MDAVTLHKVEKFVIERIASAGRVPVIDQIAAGLGRDRQDVAAVLDQLPAYAALSRLKPKYIAQLSARIIAYPAHFPTLQKCADYIVDRAEFNEVEEELKKLREPPDNGPMAA